MSMRALAVLRADLNPQLFGVLWDRQDRWMATTPSGRVLVATSPDVLRRRVRDIDGTTSAAIQTFSIVQEERT